MRFSGERLVSTVVATQMVLLAGIISVSSEHEDTTLPQVTLPHIDAVETVCVNVAGVEPFTEAACERLAATAEAGIRQFSEMTDNVLEPPHRFTHKILSETVQLDDVLTRRCTNLENAPPEDKFRALEILYATAGAALRAGDNDPHTGIVVGFNSPVEACGITPGKVEDWLLPPNDRCIPEPPDKVGYLAAWSLVDQTSRAVVSAAVPDDTELSATVRQRDIAHEWGHRGEDQIRLGHEIGLCSFKHDRLPSVIDPEQMAELGLTIRKPEGSLMSYSRDFTSSAYIAGPQLAYLGAIGKDRIVTPHESGTFVLGGPSGPELGLLHLPLTSQAVRDIIQSALPPFISATEYGLWVGEIPPSETASKNTSSKIGVYAAPLIEKSSNTPIFLLDALEQGEYLEIEGDVRLDVIGANRGTATVNVQRL